MRKFRYMLSAGLILLTLGATNISIKPAGIVIALGILLLVGAANSFLGEVRND